MVGPSPITLGRTVKPKILPTLAVALLVSGCVPYPVYKTLQPAAKASVRDAQGEPISGAIVTLVANAYPYGWEKSRETKVTMADGVAAFQARREWRSEVLMIHGSEDYFWNWCVQKEGFATFRTAHRSAAGFQTEPVVVLVDGLSQPCSPGIH